MLRPGPKIWRVSLNLRENIYKNTQNRTFFLNFGRGGGIMAQQGATRVVLMF